MNPSDLSSQQSEPVMDAGFFATILYSFMTWMESRRRRED